MIKQIAYTDENKEVYGGIMLDNGDIICACCGGLIEKDDWSNDSNFKIIGIFPDWIDLSDEIIGGWVEDDYLSDVKIPDFGMKVETREEVANYICDLVMDNAPEEEIKKAVEKSIDIMDKEKGER